MKTYREAEEILGKIKNAKNVLLALHISPDADSVGSNLAMSAFLDSLKINHQIFSTDKPDKALSFLSGWDSIKEKDPQEAAENFDTLLFLDSADISRITRHEYGIPLTGKSSINIDHHYSNPKFAQINLIDPEASSTCEIVYHLLKEWDFRISSEVATALLCGLSTDTGSFRFSASSETFAAASDLINLGASLKDVDFYLYRQVPLEALKYKAEVILRAEKLEINNIKFLFSAMDKNEIEKFGEDFAHGGSQQMNNIDGIDFGIVIDEEEEDFVSGSLRSRTGVDVSKIAGLFGGGGHKSAAGFHTKIEGNFETKKKYVLDKIVEYLKNENS